MNYQITSVNEGEPGNVEVGNIVYHKSHKLTHTLIEIKDDTGICQLPDGTKNEFPVNELIDINKQIQHYK